MQEAPREHFSVAHAVDDWQSHPLQQAHVVLFALPISHAANRTLTTGRQPDQQLAGCHLCGAYCQACHKGQQAAHVLAISGVQTFEPFKETARLDSQPDQTADCLLSGCGPGLCYPDRALHQRRQTGSQPPSSQPRHQASRWLASHWASIKAAALSTLKGLGVHRLQVCPQHRRADWRHQAGAGAAAAAAQRRHAHCAPTGLSPGKADRRLVATGPVTLHHDSAPLDCLTMLMQQGSRYAALSLGRS